MKDKNLPNDYNSLSLEELTKEANKMIEDLESQKDLENSKQMIFKVDNPDISFKDWNTIQNYWRYKIL